MAWWERRFGFFEPSYPREARGGIRAQSKRGAFGESWWARRFLAVLESFGLGARLGRGRSYARRGQVLDIAIEKGHVRARVQGSRPEPYRVTIKVKVLPAPAWRRVVTTLGREARHAAKLLAGELPEDIEGAFKDASASLFPERRGDLSTECSCPDWSNPCKHIAAVYYLLAEEFDRDPFLILKLRGLPREDLLRRLGAAGTGPRRRERVIPAPDEAQTAATEPEPLRAAPLAFWAGEGLPTDPFGEVEVPKVPAAVLRRLGRFPFWRGRSPLLEALEPVYAEASARGLEVFLGPVR